MAQRRMFSLRVIDTDDFMDMPQSTQLLYYNLAMRADDDGFVANPKRIMRMIGGNDDDFKVLIAKKYLIPFQSGVCVIRHWRIHNYIRQDRYTETDFIDEKKTLNLKNGKYEMKNRLGRPNDIPKVDTGKVRKGKVRKGNTLITNGDSKSPKRKDFRVSNKIYKKITDAYEQYRGIKLQGAEYGQVRQAIKTMLYSGRTEQDIIGFMKLAARICEIIKEDSDNPIAKKYSWFENWTCLTIKRKMAEYKAGHFKLEEDDIEIPDYAKPFQK